MGFTDTITWGVWVGNNDNQPMDKIAGSLGAAPIFKALVEKFSEGPAKFEIPDNLIPLSVCKFNGLLSKNATSSAYLEYFLKGTQPTKNCNSGPLPSSSSNSNTSPQPSSDHAVSPSSQPTTQPVGEKKEGQQGQTQIINLPEGGQIIIQNNSSTTTTNSSQ